MMRKAVLILLLLQSIPALAQIRISGFRESLPDGAVSGLGTSCTDPDGNPCAVLRIETRQVGWTFDTGLSGIMDTRYEDGLIWLYVPAYARFLTVAHKEYGVLREWAFPVSLEPGRTYTITLSYGWPLPATASIRGMAEMPAPSPQPKPAAEHRLRASAPQTQSYKPSPRLPDPFRTQRDEKEFCHHFADFYTGLNCSGDAFGMSSDSWHGLSYTWIGNRIGPYLSIGTNFDGFSVFGGAAYRITDPGAASLDWQVYSGAGVLDGAFGFEIGMRFAWRSTHRLSHWDFGFGCQLAKGTVMPTVSVGLYIWGVPALICIGIMAGALGR